MFFLARAFFSALIVVLLLCLDAKAHEFESWEYEQIRDVAFSIVDGKPLSDHVVVGVGRTPTPIVAFFQNVDPNIALNMPLSRFGFARPGSVLGDLSPSEEQELFTHFDRYLGRSLKAGKKLIVVDFISLGRTFRALQHHLDRYAQSRGVADAVEYCMLGSSMDFMALKKTFTSARYRFISTPFSMYEDSLTKKFAGDTYKAFAEYGQYEIRGIFNDPPKRETEPRPEYKEFKTDLQKKMAADTTLVCSLALSAF